MNGHTGRAAARRLAAWSLTPLLVLALTQCQETTGPELGQMLGTLGGERFAGEVQASIVTTDGVRTLVITGHRPSAEEWITFRLPYPSVLRAAVQADVRILHTLGGDVRVGEYAGVGTLTITELSESEGTVEGEFAFSATSTYGSFPRYGPSVSFTDGRFRAAFSAGTDF